ncbi:response regulator transcription factor [Candidatus Gracilibacteria bacterium]|nr:response regulator transcription factor [Candidatus Gracilibacteria bacterium]
MKVLIVEDTQALATTMVRFLATKNIQADISPDGIDGLYKAATKYYDAIVLDINLPEKDGITLCRELREKEKDVPVIMLTSRSSKEDIIAGLEAGADDYLIKPFDYEILVARLDALTRRNLKNKSTTTLTIGDYVIDLIKREVYTSKKTVHLSNLEFDLLKYFAQNKNKVITRQELYEKVWGEFEGNFMFSKTVDVYIGYLRKKLGREIILTKKGYGYISE